jgi:hypothetical protein
MSNLSSYPDLKGIPTICEFYKENPVSALVRNKNIILELLEKNPGTKYTAGSIQERTGINSVLLGLVLNYLQKFKLIKTGTVIKDNTNTNIFVYGYKKTTPIIDKCENDKEKTVRDSIVSYQKKAAFDRICKLLRRNTGLFFTTQEIACLIEASYDTARSLSSQMYNANLIERQKTKTGAHQYSWPEEDKSVSSKTDKTKEQKKEIPTLKQFYSEHTNRVPVVAADRLLPFVQNFIDGEGKGQWDIKGISGHLGIRKDIVGLITKYMRHYKLVNYSKNGNGPFRHESNKVLHLDAPPAPSGFVDRRYRTTFNRNTLVDNQDFVLEELPTSDSTKTDSTVAQPTANAVIVSNLYRENKITYKEARQLLDLDIDENNTINDLYFSELLLKK